MRVLIALAATLSLCSTALPDNVNEKIHERLEEVDASIELLNQCFHILQNDISQCVSNHPAEPTTTVELSTVTQPAEHATPATSEHSDTEPPTNEPEEMTERTEHITSSTPDHSDTNTEPPTENAYTESPTGETGTELHTEMAEEVELGQLRGWQERNGGGQSDEENRPIYVVHIDRSDPSGEVVDVYPYWYTPHGDSQSRLPAQTDEPPTNLLGYPGEEPVQFERDDPYFVIVDDDGGDGEPNLYIARTVSSGKKHKGPHHRRGPHRGRGPLQKKLGGLNDQLLHLLLLQRTDEPESPISNKWLMWFKNKAMENTSEPLVPEHSEATEEPTQAVSTEHPEPTHPILHNYKSPPVTAIGTHHPLPSNHPTEPANEYPTQKLPGTTVDTPTTSLVDTNTASPTAGRPNTIDTTHPVHEGHHTLPPTESIVDTPTTSFNDTNTASPTAGKPNTIDTTNPTTSGPTTDSMTNPTTDATTTPTTGSPATTDTTSPTPSSPSTTDTTSPTTGSTTTTNSPTTDSATGSPATTNADSPDTTSPITSSTASPSTDNTATVYPGTTENSTSFRESSASDVPTTSTHATETQTTGSPDNHSTIAPTTEDRHHETDYTDATNNSRSSPETNAPTLGTGRPSDNPSEGLATQATPTDTVDYHSSGDDLLPSQGDTDFAKDDTEPPTESSDHSDPTVKPEEDLAESYLVVNIDRSTGTDVVSAYITNDANSESLGGIGRNKGKGIGKSPMIIDRDKKVTVIVVINEGGSPTSLPTGDSQVPGFKTKKPGNDEEGPLYPDGDFDPYRSEEDVSDGYEMSPVPVHEVTKTAGGTYGYGKAVDDAVNFALQNSKRRRRGTNPESHVKHDADNLYDDPSNIPTKVDEPSDPTAQECLKLFSHYFRHYYLQEINFNEREVGH